MSVLLGVHARTLEGDAARRQARALAAWPALRGARLANLQFPDAVVSVDGFATHPVLTRGGGEPVVAEMLDRLAEMAAVDGSRWIGVAEADVQPTQAAIDRITADPRDGYAFSRTDFHPRTGHDIETVASAVGLFVVSADWWRHNSRRFREYLLGEPVWDAAFASILLCHSDAAILHREPLVRHERHPAADPRRSPHAAHTAALARLDAPYLERWAAYHHALAELRARGTPAEAEDELRGRIFHAPHLLARAAQAGRALAVRLRHRTRGTGA